VFAIDGEPLISVNLDHTALVLLELGVVLLVLGVLGRLAARLGIPSVPLYLLSGLALGEGGIFPIAAGEEFLSVAAEIGVVVLLLLLGLEYSPADLRNGIRGNWQAGVVDIFASGTPGVLLGLLLGWDLPAALLLGGVTYISSSGIIARLLGDFDRLANRETPVILSLLVMEDVVMAVFLPIMAVVLVGASLLQGAVAAAIAVGVVAMAVFIASRYSTVISKAIHSHSRELLLLSVLGLTFLVAGFAEATQVSAAVGAFLLGLTLSGRVADELHDILPPLRDVFGGIFFVFFGLTINPADLPAVLLPAAALAVVTALTKVGTGVWAASRAGIKRKGQWRAGLSLIARGEFSIVIAGIGVSAGVESTLGPLAAAYVLILAVTGSVLMRYADRIPSPLPGASTSPSQPRRIPRAGSTAA
jgi:monovalent cation:H+ antiporter-2, CPA2 family